MSKKENIKCEVTFEKCVYFFIWIVSILVALLKFVMACENLPSVDPTDFSLGWSFLHRLKDASDTEWTILTSVFKEYWYLLFFEIICLHVIRRENKKVPLFYAVYSLCCLFLILGTTVSLSLILYIVAMYITHLSGKKILCYILSICSLVLIHNSSFYNLKEVLGLSSTETKSFLFDVGLGWLSAKCLSFAVDRIEANEHRRIIDTSIIVAYCFFLPALFSGPIISYESFRKQITKTAEPVSAKKMASDVLYLFYLMLYYFLYEFLLHFVYSSAVAYYPEIMNDEYDRWAICGLAYALPMMFYLKYFTIYGMAGSLAKLEGIELPPPPKCISSIHVSSFLWRHFDRGLYLWILRYLYHPLLNSGLHRIYAISLSFFFVYLWHGTESAICIWSILNCILVLTEVAAKKFVATELGSRFQDLPIPIYDRICAAFATPHFIMMCISSAFFLSNFEIGMLLINKMLLGGAVPLATLSLAMYCGCHVSVNVRKFQDVK